MSPAGFIFAQKLNSWIPKRLAPGCPASGRIIPARVARIGAVDVALALRIGVAIVELPVNQAHVRVLCNISVDHGSRLVSSDVAATQGRRGLDSSFPRQDAVLVVGCVIARVPCGDAVGKAYDATTIQLARRSEGNDYVLNGAVRTGDGHSDRGNDRIQGGGMAAADEFEVIPAGDPIAGTDVQVALHAGRTNAETLAAACGGTTA